MALAQVRLQPRGRPLDLAAQRAREPGAGAEEGVHPPPVDVAQVGNEVDPTPGLCFLKKKKSKIIWRKLAQMIKKHLNFFVHSGQRWYSLSSISSLWPSSGDCVCAQLLMILRQ